MLLNAAGAIAAAGHAANLAEGLVLARAAIDSGAAGERLDALLAFSQAGAPASRASVRTSPTQVPDARRSQRRHRLQQVGA